MSICEAQLRGHVWFMQDNTLSTYFNTNYGLVSAQLIANGSTTVGSSAYLTAGANQVLHQQSFPNTLAFHDACEEH